MSVEEAKKLIDEYYEDAKKKEYIKNPLAWAIYQTWRDVHEPRVKCKHRQ